MKKIIWVIKCIVILLVKYRFNLKMAWWLSTSFDDDQREDNPKEVLEEEFSYWVD